MRWCLYISSILILLTLSMELCCWNGSALVKDASHLACVLDDDDAELKHDVLGGDSCTECDLLTLAGWHGVVRLVNTDLISTLKGAEIWKIHAGIRRHRWLCRECC